MDYESGDTVEVFGGVEDCAESPSDEEEELVSNLINSEDIQIFRRAGKRSEYLSELRFAIGGEMKVISYHYQLCQVSTIRYNVPFRMH